jgi:methionine synthase II (cobalamin-independent)
MRHLKGYVARLPDGEVGERDTWIRWQYEKIGRSRGLEQSKRESVYVPVRPFQLSADVASADDIVFPDLGYAEAAIASFDVFRQLSDEGVIAQGVRFMVGLPTPLSVALFYVEPDSRILFEQAYGRAIEQELLRMLAHIPPDRLAIQWETVSEFALLEGLMDNHLDGDLPEHITTRLAALCALVPDPAEVGIHLCYGDSGHKHFCEPADTAFLAQIAAGTLAKAARDLAWVHLPVPRDRHDAAYFAPLADLVLPRDTELYLGLIHQTGGAQGTRRRIEAAARIVPDFGVATECGLGRRPLETIPALLRQHTEVAAPLR